MTSNTVDPFAGDFKPSLSTALYPLRMEGSPEAPEGLLSWIVGLAQAHCVGPRTLMRHLLSNSEEYRRLWSVSTFFDRDCGTINGHGRYADMMVELIGDGQPVSPERMTLLPLAKLLPRNGEGFLGRSPRWCHACLCAQAREGVRPHYPLVWSFDYYTVCHVHQVGMSERCPACGCMQPFLPSYPSLVHCGCCGLSLIAGTPGGFLLDEREVTEFSVWCGGALADMVSRLLSLEAEGELANLRSNVDRLCGQLTDGNRKQLCRDIGLQPYALKGWMKGERPSLAVLLRLCFGTRVMPAAMFLPEPVGVLHEPTPVRITATSERLTRPQLGYKERERIKNLLDVIIADTGDARRLVDIAEQVGLSRSALKYWFREECRILVLKSRLYEDRRMLLKFGSDHALLRSVVQNLRAQKMNLSRWQVNPELRKHKVSLIRPDLFKALEWMRLD